MCDNFIIKVCYFCDYPRKVCTNYEDILHTNCIYGANIKKYNDLWVCFSCNTGNLRWTDFSIQENGECCVCLEEKILLNLPKCTHKLCIQCSKTIYYGSTTVDPPTASLNDIERPEWPYPFYCSNEEELKGTRKDWMIWDDKEEEYSGFSNEYFNDFYKPELKNKSYDELVAIRDSLISEKVEERLDWMNTEEFINYENLLFQYQIEQKKITKQWNKYKNTKTIGNGLCPICRSKP